VGRRCVGLGVVDDGSGLRASTLPTWETAVSRLGDSLSRGDGPALDERDVLLLLRPFLWYVHALSFQDLADAGAAALHVLNGRRDALLEQDEVRGDFLALGLLLAAFLEEQSLDASGWTTRSEPLERVAITSARRLAAHLGDEPALLELSRTLEVLGAAKDAALACIGALGSRSVPHLDLIHALDPEDQRLVRSALANHEARSPAGEAR